MAAAIDTANAQTIVITAAVTNAVTLASCVVASSDNALIVSTLTIPVNPGQAPNTVTWNGSSLTLLSQQNDAAQAYTLTVWYLLNPTPGTGSVVVTTTSGGGMSYGSIAHLPLSGVLATNAGTAFGTPSWTYNGAGSVTTISATCSGTTSSNDIYFGWGFLATNTIARTGGQTNATFSNATNASQSYDSLPGTSAGPMSYSGTGGVQTAGVALALPIFGSTGAYRGGSTASFASGVASFPITVSSIGILPGDIVTLWVAGTFTGSDPNYTFPAGFGPVAGLVDRSAAGTSWLGVAYKIAGIEPTTYTITAGSNSILTGTVQCRVYSGRSGLITGTNYLGSSGSAPPVTFALAGITGKVNDCIVAVTMTVPNNTNGTQTLAPSSGFGNALVSTVASVQCIGLAGQDYVSFPGGSTGTIAGVFSDTGSETNIHYLGFVIGFAQSGGSTPPSGPMPRQLYIMP
jgi:hypothetical protein